MTFDEYCELCQVTTIPDQREFMNLVLQGLCGILEASGGGGGGEAGAAVSKAASVGTLDMAVDNNDSEVSMTDYASVAVQVSGMTDGTITPEGSLDGTTWPITPLWGKNVAGQSVGSITEDGVYFFNGAVLNRFRLRVEDVGTGNVALEFSRSTVPLE